MISVHCLYTSKPKAYHRYYPYKPLIAKIGTFVGLPRAYYTQNLSFENIFSLQLFLTTRDVHSRMSSVKRCSCAFTGSLAAKGERK